MVQQYQVYPGIDERRGGKTLKQTTPPAAADIEEGMRKPIGKNYYVCNTEHQLCFFLRNDLPSMCQLDRVLDEMNRKGYTNLSMEKKFMQNKNWKK